MCNFRNRAKKTGLKAAALSCSFLLLLICGCKTELYSGLDERDANEMLAVMLKNGIDCEKMPGNEDTWALHVEKNQIARAVDLLSASGYPRNNYASMGDIFKKEGLVSSPMEERVRFVYALSQEISKTLSHIDGVLSARVHIVLPENNPLSDTVVPSSASVFIKHRPFSGVEFKVPEIKKLVINSIEGLSYDNVTVLLFESAIDFEDEKEPALKKIAGVYVASESAGRFRVVLGAGLIIVLLCLSGMGYSFYYIRKNQIGKNEADG